MTRALTFLFYYRTSFSLFFSLFLSVCLLLWVNEPPKLPINPLAKIVDCAHIHLVDMKNDGSTLKFQIRTDPFVEFPRSTALQLIRVILTTGVTLSEFSFNNFWDIESDLVTANFTILPVISGPSTVQMMCGALPFVNRSITLGNITNYPIGFSRSLHYSHTTFSLVDVCFANDSLVFFSKIPVYLPPVRISFNENINYSISYHSIQQYTGFYQYRLVDRPTFMISGQPEKAWEQLVDVVIPFYGSVFGYLNTIKPNVFLLFNQDSIIENIKPFGVNEIIYNTNGICFREFSSAKSIGSVSMLLNSTQHNGTYLKAVANHIEWVLIFKPSVIRQLKAFYTLQGVVPGRVVVDEYSRRLIPIISKIYPQLTFDVIPDTTSLTRIASIVASAQFYIASSIQTLVFSLFMSPGSRVIEYKPIGTSQVDIVSKFAYLAGVQYKILYKQDQNNLCSDLLCYLQQEEHQQDISREMIIEVFQ